MSYEEARKERRRSRRNERTSMMLAALGVLGRTIQGELQASRAHKNQLDLETLRMNRAEKLKQQEWDVENQRAAANRENQLDLETLRMNRTEKLKQQEWDVENQRAAANRENQLDIAKLYAGSRSQSMPAAWVADAEMADDPELAAERAQLDELAKSNDFFAGVDNEEEIKSRKAELQQKARKLWLERKRGLRSKPADSPVPPTAPTGSGGGFFDRAFGEVDRAMQTLRGGAQPVNDQESNPAHVQGSNTQSPQQATSMYQVFGAKLADSYKRWMVNRDPVAWMELNQFAGGSLPPPPEALPLVQPSAMPQQINPLGSTFQQSR